MQTPENTLHIYTRVSTKSQAEDGVSLDTQLEEGIKKQKQLGFEYYQHWDEDVASSDKEDLSNRPVMRELLMAVEEGKVKFIYALDNTRLSRNEDTQFMIGVAFRKQGVILHTNTITTDFSKTEDLFLRRILEAVSTYENTIRTIRSRLGKLRRVKEGFWYGGQHPYGYEIVDKRLALHPEESKWVKKMFDMYYEGQSILSIKQLLDKNGVIARRGGLFNVGSINRLFQNTHYIGYFIYHDKKYDEKVRVECPRIVDETVWNAVQKKRETTLKRKGQINRTTHFYLLRDILHCGHCGSPMSGRTKPSKYEHYYYCPSKTRNWKKGAIPEDKKWARGKVQLVSGSEETAHPDQQTDYGCDMTRSINIDVADEFVWKNVKEVVKNSSILKEQFKTEVLQSTMSVKNTKDAEKKEDKKQKALQRDLSRIKQTLADLDSSKLVGDYSGDAESFELVRNNLQKKISEINEAVEQSQMKVQQLGNERKWIDWLNKFGESVDEKELISPEVQREYLQGLLERIDVNLNHETNAHTISLYFKLGVINDTFQWISKKHKPWRYEITEGEKEMTFEVPFVENRGRKKKGQIIPPLKTSPLPLSDFQRGYFSNPNVDVFITFRVDIEATHLWGNHYSDYQEHLYDLITNKIDDGMNYKQVADWLNDNGYTTPRGKTFRNNHTHSIVKKGTIRKKRMSARFKPVYSDMKVKFMNRVVFEDSEQSQT